MRQDRHIFQAQPLFIGILTLAFGALAPLQAQTVSFAGRAYDLKTRKHVYSEYVTRKFQGGKVVSQYTVYKDPAGKTIATKSLRFPRGPYLASFHLKDNRDGYEEGTIAGGSVTMFLKKNSSAAKETKNFPAPAGAVADDGVDLYLRDNLDKLKAGQGLSINLAVPNRWDWFKFTARKTATTKRKGREAIVISMTLDNAILRRLLPVIKFVYDAETKALYEFQGVSVLNGPDKKSYRVRTVYGPENKK